MKVFSRVVPIFTALLLVVAMMPQVTGTALAHQSVSYTEDINFEDFDNDTKSLNHTEGFGQYNFWDYSRKDYEIDSGSISLDSEEESSKITGLIIYYNRNYVDGIQIVREDGMPTDLHGTAPQNDYKVRISVGAGEYLTFIGYESDGTHMSQLRIETNKKHYGAFGQSTSGEEYKYYFAPWNFSRDQRGDYYNPDDERYIPSYYYDQEGYKHYVEKAILFNKTLLPYEGEEYYVNRPFDYYSYYGARDRIGQYDEKFPYSEYTKSKREIIGFWGRTNSDGGDGSLAWLAPITLKHDHGQLKKVSGKAATCYEDGNVEHYICGNERKPCNEMYTVYRHEEWDQFGHNYIDRYFYSPISEEELMIHRLGHYFDMDPTYEWSDDYKTVIARVACRNDASHKFEYAVYTVEKDRQEPTCTETGRVTYTAEFGNYPYYNNPHDPHNPYDPYPSYYIQIPNTEKTVEIPIDPTAHKFEEVEPLVIWNEDMSGATAMFKCKHNAYHTMVKTTSATPEETKEASCTEAGEMTYTAVFKEGEKEFTFKETEPLPATGHNWGEWSVTREATTEADGEEARQCTACEEKETRAIPKLEAVHEHDWNEPAYIWSAGYDTVTAIRDCSTDDTHVQKETVKTTSTVKKEPSCTEKGITLYTTKAFKNGAFVKQEKEVDIPKTDHRWGQWEVTKEATAEADGEETRQCAVCKEKETRVNPKLGVMHEHDWNEPAYIWSAGYDTVTAIRDCSIDDSHVQKETVKTTSTVKKEPTCTDKGITLYTTKDFKNEAFAKQEKEVDTPKTGHDWSQWKVTKEATIKAEGEESRTCKICGEKESLPIPKLQQISTPTPEPKPVPAPEPAKQISVMSFAKMKSKGLKGITISWNKAKGVDGYDIFMSRCDHNGNLLSGKKVKTIKNNKTFKWTKKKLKKKTAYKAYVRPFIIKEGKKTYVGKSPLIHEYTSGGTKKYTNAKSVKVKKAKVTLKRGKTYGIKASVKKLKANKKLMTKEHGPKIRYLSTNKKVATVTKKGKIKAKAKGKCTIIVYAHNGANKKVKVTVK